MDKKALLFEPKASFNAFPFFVLHNREPEGQRSAVAFLCFLSLAKQRKGVAVGPPPTCERSVLAECIELQMI